MKGFTLTFLFLLIAGCNNQFVVTKAPNKDIYLGLLGVADRNYGESGVTPFPNSDPTKSSDFRTFVTFANGETYGHMNYTNSGNVARSAIVKINRVTGQPDPSFGTGGVVEIPVVAALVNDTSWSYRAVGFKNRYILMCGLEVSAGAYHATVKLFDTQIESLVPTFGTAGTYSYNSSDVTRPNAIAETCDWDENLNRIVFAGRDFASFSTSKMYVGVLDMTGNLVASFNGGSILPVNDAALVDAYMPSKILITSDSYTIIGYQWTGSYYQSILYKISKAGVGDPAFGTNGLILNVATTAANGLVTRVRNLYPDGAGNLIALVSNFSGSYNIMKFSHSSGTPIMSFGTAGIVDIRALLEPEFGPFTSFFPSNLLRMENGHFLVHWSGTVGGITTNYLTEFDTSWAIVRRFGDNGTYTFVTASGLPSVSVYFPDKITVPLFTGGFCYSAFALRTACAWKIE